MDRIRNLPWPLVLGLGALALVPALIGLVAARTDTSPTPLVPIVSVLVIPAVWVTVVGLTRVPDPVLTLVATAAVYAVVSMALSGILTSLLEDELDGPLATPISIVPVLLMNLLAGAVYGVLARLLQHARTPGERDRPGAGR